MFWENCGTKLEDADRFCPKCGRAIAKGTPAVVETEARRRGVPNGRNVLAVAVLFLAILLAIALAPKSGDSSNSAEPSAAIIMSDYDRIQDGMTYVDVGSKLGAGEQLTDSTSGANTVRSYIWRNPDGSYLEVSFENDRVYHKSQHGLRR